MTTRGDSCPSVPFPLQEREGRLQAIQKLYAATEEHKLASEMTTLRGLQANYPDMDVEELIHLNNQVLIMIAEYHLTSASQGSHSIPPVLPAGAARLVPSVNEYLPPFVGVRDVRLTDRAEVFRVAVWLHRLDLSTTYGAEVAASPRVQEYDIGPLLEYFLMPKLANITHEEVALRVAQENRRDMESSLQDLHEERGELQNGIGLLTSALDREQARERRKSIKKQLDSRRKELRLNQERISRLEDLLGLEQPEAQSSPDVIVEETTETTIMAEEETENQATPPD